MIRTGIHTWTSQYESSGSGDNTIYSVAKWYGDGLPLVPFGHVTRLCVLRLPSLIIHNITAANITTSADIHTANTMNDYLMNDPDMHTHAIDFSPSLNSQDEPDYVMLQY